jgi:hypothetical protein
MRQNLTAYGMIRPALDAMQLESYLKPYDFLQLATHAGLVPRNRVDVVAKGLYAGYCGDYVQAILFWCRNLSTWCGSCCRTPARTQRPMMPMGWIWKRGLATLVQRPQMIEVFGQDLTLTLTFTTQAAYGPLLFFGRTNF